MGPKSWSACRRRRRWCPASRSRCSGRGRSRGIGDVEHWPPVRPTTTILPSVCSATPLASSKPPKSVVCLPSPEKLVSSEPFGVVAGEGELDGAARVVEPVPPTATILPSAWSASAFACRSPRSWSSACRRRRSSCRASRWGCSGRARSRTEAAAKPTATILPSPWSATAFAPPGRPRSRSSACRRRRSSCRATRSAL